MGDYVVYKHTSPSGKVYVGITGQSPKQRWGHGVNYSYNKRFRNAILKYGWDSFDHEILFDGLTYEDACAKEIEMIARYDSTNRDRGYNVDLGGHSRPTGEKNPLYGRKRDPEVVARISEKRRGKPWSATLRRAREEYHKANPAHNKGKHASEETREKLRVAHLGQSRPHEPKTIQKIRQSQPNARPVARTDSNGGLVVYDSISEAARALGEKKHIKENIRQCCHGQRKSACGYVWSFVEEVDNVCMTSNL